MKPLTTLVVSLLLLAPWVSGCQSGPEPPRTLEGIQAKVRPGMSKAEVQDLLGMPDEQTSGLNAMWIYKKPGGGGRSVAIVFAGQEVDAVREMDAGP